jgi:predicted SPOUT superfamily RNA methylase MTH1
VDEVVVYNDGTVPNEETGGISEPNAFLAHVLQFLETPQYIYAFLNTNSDTYEHIYSQCILISAMPHF